MTTRIIHADHVLLGDSLSHHGGAIANGVVVVDAHGTILDVGEARNLLGDGSDGSKTSHADVAIERIHGVIFPGLVNAHTHIELSSMRGKVPGGHGFVAWVDRMITTRSETSVEEDAEGIDLGIEEIKRSATVAVGDVTNSLSPVAALARSGIAGCIFHEVFGMDRDVVRRRVEGLRAEVEERVPSWPTTELAYAPSPHTLFTLHTDAARVMLDSAARRGLRASIHLAEHASERRAVEQGDGPIPEWYERRLKQRPEWPKRPLFDVAADVGALREGVVLVHLTDARPDELARVASSGASVVLCPRSNLYIENRLPPLLAIREAGIQAALGTDSLASNTSLDVLAEARALADRFPNVPASELFTMATWNGARALGRSDLGRIAQGARPGIFAVEGDVPNGSDPHAFLIKNVRAARREIVSRRAAKQSNHPTQTTPEDLS